MEILKQTKNELLHREEVVVFLESTVTPSNQETLKTLAEHFKKPEETIVIEHIYSSFGLQKFKVIAKIYDSAESKVKYETVTRKQRKKDAEEEKKKAEEEVKAVAEKPAEETASKEVPQEGKEENK